MIRLQQIQDVLRWPLASMYVIAMFYLVRFQLEADEYLSAALIAIFCVIVAFGHVNRQRWASQTTAFLLIAANVYAVFYYFPPFGDSAGSDSFDIRVLKFCVVTSFCVGLSFILYMQQRKSPLRGAEREEMRRR